jgi:diguanylate cyclase (GGDEF)-like protein
MRAVSKRITGPIERMYRCLKGFRYDTNEDREENFERLKELDINANPEIQSLYNALVQTTLESYTYQQEYQVAAERLGLASEMAYKDALTGVNNKNSYDNELKDIQKQIDNGEKLDISVLMIDINNLKNVNDTYGHSNGDLYIIGCCDIIRKRCRNSHIYRIGGDEFTVLLKGKDYDDRQNIYSDIVSGFESAFTDRTRQLWERYSASVGMADYGLGDASFSDAVKRADSAMYKAKSEFKEKYGSYR